MTQDLALRRNIAARISIGAAIALAAIGSALAGTVDLPASGGGKQRVLYLQPNNPAVALILFPGGDGQIKLRADGTSAAGGNFLVRTRDEWVRQGMAVAIPDVPDNQRNLFNRRTTADYAGDIAQIITGDKCAITPPADAARIKVALTSSRRVEIATVSGGLPPVSEPCEAKAEHGFYGIESDVVAQIAAWIKSNSK